MIMNNEELKIKELSNHISIYDYELKLSNDDIEEMNQDDNLINDYDFCYDYQFNHE